MACTGLIAAGCGSSSSSSTTSSSAASSAATPQTSSAQQPSQPSTSTQAKSTTASKSAVTIANYAYAPAQLTVAVGQKVTFTNHDSANHTATSDKAGAFDTGNLDQGHAMTITFSKPGIYTYHCQFHPFMHGRIVVR